MYLQIEPLTSISIFTSIALKNDRSDRDREYSYS